MEKKVVVLHKESKLIFSFSDRDVKVCEEMSVADAEVIAAQYPGLYVEVIEVPAKDAKPAKKAD